LKKQKRIPKMFISLYM